MSAAKRRGRWQGGGATDSTQIRQGVPNAVSGILQNERREAARSLARRGRRRQYSSTARRPQRSQRHFDSTS
jgi:hypothetical protein